MRNKILNIFFIMALVFIFGGQAFALTPYSGMDVTSPPAGITKVVLHNPTYVCYDDDSVMYFNGSNGRVFELDIYYGSSDYYTMRYYTGGTSISYSQRYYIDWSTPSIIDIPLTELGGAVNSITRRGTFNKHFVGYYISAPNTPTVTYNTSSKKVQVSWNSVVGATAFDLYRDNVLLATLSSSTTNYTDIYLAPGKTYSYKVVARSYNYPAESSSASVTIPNVTISGNATGLQWSKTSGRGKVNLTWNSVAGATGYKIFVFNGYQWELVQTLGNVTSWDSSVAKVFPSDSQINSLGTNTAVIFGWASPTTGFDFLDDATKMYIKTQGTTYDASRYYKLAVKATGFGGTYSESEYSNVLDITLPNRTDNTIPNADVIINGGVQKTGSNSITVGINANDTESGVSTIELSNDGINYTLPEAYNNGFVKSWIIESGPGTKKIWARITDYAGNQYIATGSVYLVDDVSGPAVNLLFNNGQTVTSSASGTLTINAVDDYSDLSQLTMQVSSDGITWKGYNGSSWVDNYVGSFRATVPWSLSSGDGWKDIFIKVIDGQGNYTIKKITIALSSPSASPIGNAGTSSTTTTTAINSVNYQVLSTPQVQVVITGQSNITEISWSFDGLNFSPFETPLTVSGNIQKDFTFSGSEGIKGLYFKYRNIYGQESNVNNLKFVVDTTPPEVKITTAKGQAEGATSLSNISLFVDVKDNISKSYQYSLDGGAWTNLPSNGIITKSGLTAGTKGTLYLIRVKVKDEAGNITEKSIKVYRLP